MNEVVQNMFIRFAVACQPGAGGNILGLPTWYKYLEGEAIGTKCAVVFAFPQDIGAILLAITEILLRIGVYVAIAMVVWGGFQYQLSQGQPDKTKSARSTIINALVGVVIAVLATAIVNLIGRNIL